MRSELITAARRVVENRYALCHAAAKAARKFHRSRSRMQDTTNEVLRRIAKSRSQVVLHPAKSEELLPQGAAFAD
jgi:tRNA threonylcarbamoyladenosine modification (KEOPS) complex Cgi121 subunit